jgi:trk system potassium uptake protein TrkH
MAAVLLISYLTQDFFLWIPLVQGILLMGFPAISFLLLTRSDSKIVFYSKEAFLVTVLLWGFTCLGGSVLFYLIFPGYSFIDSLFDATSALTTTGCTSEIILENHPFEILLWRSLLEWLGGIGIIMMVLIFLPSLQLGGGQLFKIEFSDRSEKILPKLSQVVQAILKVYSLSTILSMVTLKIVGNMSWFESWLNISSAISTTGIFYHLNLQNPWILILLSFVMLMGGCSFLIFVKWWYRGFKWVKNDPQLRLYLTLLSIGWLGASFSLFLQQNQPILSSLIDGLAISSSFLTTTGFLFSHQVWPPIAVSLLLILSSVGGCVGSTSGGIKVYRLHILIEVSRSYLQTILKPSFYTHVIHSQRSQALTISIFTFCILYLGVWLGLSLLLIMSGLSLGDGFLAAIMSLGNIGNGLMELCGHTFAYQTFSGFTKMILILGMIIGRLELMSILILFHPSFWRR